MIANILFYFLNFRFIIVKSKLIYDDVCNKFVMDSIVQ